MLSALINWGLKSFHIVILCGDRLRYLFRFANFISIFLDTLDTWVLLFCFLFVLYIVILYLRRCYYLPSSLLKNKY